MYIQRVSRLEAILEDLKSLPADRLEMAADYIRQLKPIAKEETNAALDRTFGCLAPEEADRLEKIIGEGCEQINGHGW